MSFENVKHHPIGTLQEVIDAGMDPEDVATCHRNVAGEIRGCPFWKSCQFHIRSRGGFKGKGPHYIGYHLRTSKADGRRQKEDVASCFAFVATLQGRMLAGMNAKNKGEDYELIQIIAQEGEEILVKEYKSVAADGGNRSGDIRIAMKPVKLTVPAFPRPGDDIAVTYNQILDQRATEREREEEDMEESREERMARLRADAESEGELVVPDVIAKGLVGKLDEPEDGTETVPAAEPEEAPPVAKQVKPSKR